jgi:hypothetical protein
MYESNRGNREAHAWVSCRHERPAAPPAALRSARRRSLGLGGLSWKWWVTATPQVLSIVILTRPPSGQGLGRLVCLRHGGQMDGAPPCRPSHRTTMLALPWCCTWYIK